MNPRREARMIVFLLWPVLKGGGLFYEDCGNIRPDGEDTQRLFGYVLRNANSFASVRMSAHAGRFWLGCRSK